MMLSFPGSTRGSNKAQLQRQLDFSKKLQVVTNKVHSTRNLDEIMLDLAKDICDLFGCERLTIYAVSKDKEFIYSKIKTGIESSQDLVLPINCKSVAGFVAANRRCVRLNNVYDNRELHNLSPEIKFLQVVDKITGYHTKQMLAAPIQDEKTGQLLGVIQLLNNKEGFGFTETDEDGLQDLCLALAIAFAQRLHAPPTSVSKYESLVVDCVISAPEMELAVRWARRKELDFEQVLIDEFQVRPEAIGHALSKYFHVPYEGFQARRPKPSKLLTKLNRTQILRQQWLPLGQDTIGMTILCIDPNNSEHAHNIGQAFPYTNLLFRVTTKHEFAQTVELFFTADKTA